MAAGGGAYQRSNHEWTGGAKRRGAMGATQLEVDDLSQADILRWMYNVHLGSFQAG